MFNFDFAALLKDFDQGSFTAYLLAIGVSVIFAGLFDILYRVYFLRDGRGIQVNRAFIIIAPAVTSIFLVIQFSLPLSLGLLGALSFVRFRTPIKEPEEIGFILLVIASSLSCAVFRFEVGFLILAFAVLACLIKQFSLFSRVFLRKPRLDIFLTGNPDDNSMPERGIREALADYRNRLEFVSRSLVEGETSFHLRVIARQSPEESDRLTHELKKLAWVRGVNIHLNG